jgi:uncharacterized coiled-coil protein SlyX
MMGNALIQPTMYFNLRNVPLFSGPYMITSIQHRISENGFDTTFEGQRQPFYSIPAIDNILQSLTSKILETLKTRLEEQDKEIQEKNNILAQKSETINKINSDKNVLTANQNCSESLTPTFSEYTNTTPTQRSITFDEAIDKIDKKIFKLNLDDNNKNKLENIILAIMYAESGVGQKFVAYDYNFASVNLNVNPWGDSKTYMNKKYYCVNRGNNKNIPLASFDSFDSFIDLFIAKFKNRTTGIQTYTFEDNSYKESLAKAYVTLWPSKLDDNVWDDLPDSDKEKIKNKISVPIKYIIEKFGL